MKTLLITSGISLILLFLNCIILLCSASWKNIKKKTISIAVMFLIILTFSSLASLSFRAIFRRNSHSREWAWDEVEETKEYDVYSLKPTGTAYSTGFFLGFGYIESEPCYFFYVSEDSGYKLKWEEAESTSVVETGNVSPCLTYMAEPWEMLEYRLYVPVGTISVQFKL